MNLFRTNSHKHFYLTLFLWATTTAFPTEVSEFTQLPKSKISRPEDITSMESFRAKALQSQNASSISTTSSLLFKDKTPILTYLLGQPKKQGSVSSPAHLLSPDRYEFFTFDDDGQIVKKLMSVKEIQKIIANNEKGSLGEHGSPIEYYQILTVTPDVESIPSVSRINPNEPLFSIHDVIASVQNVLKSEIKIKQSQSLSKLNNTNSLASASSEHFEILTEKPPSSFKHKVQNLTSSSIQQTTNAPPGTFTFRQETTIGTEKATTSRPSEINYTFVEENAATTDASITQTPTALMGSAITHVTEPLMSTFGTLKPLVSSSQEVFPQTTSASKVTVAAPAQEPQPLSLNDAHPGLLSNDTFFDMKPFTLEQISRIAEPLIQDLKASPSSTSTGNFVKVETVQPVQVHSVNAGETSTSKAEIPITPDLAESVSNVLWQIASENSMVDSANKPTEPVVLSTETKIPETFQKAESNHPVKSTPFFTTTELPAQSRSTEKLSENPVSALENILRPQNRPRPFQKVPPFEKENPDALESRVELFSTVTPAYDSVPSPSSTVVILTEEEPNPTSEAQLSNHTGSFSSTTPPQSFVISISPDAVVQSPEQLKPVSDKSSVANLNGTSGQNQSQQTIEGVQIIQEASIGQIPRTTEYPGQVVKEIQRMEVPSIGSVATEESLVDSASNIYTTQLPEETTIVENAEQKTEVPEQEKFENIAETTTLNLELAESKNNLPEDVKHTSASDRIDITFVPMVIKTPSAFKQETLLKAESQTEKKEEPTTTENSITEQTDITEAGLTETPNPNPQHNFESKELPEATSEFKNNAPKTTTEVTQKESIFADDSDFQIGNLKQNVLSKPHFGKPQKPLLIKPVKAKPPVDVKAPKPSATVKPFPREPESKKPYENHLQSSPSVLELDAAPAENLGLEATVANLDGDVKRFADLCNELAFSLWSSVTHNGLSFVRSVVISPFGVTSLLAMVFLGARGPTSGQMNDILKLDDMVTFNPHLVFRNVTESLVISRNPGVATTAFVRELYSDKSKGKLLDFYKERVQQFYDGHVEEVNFKTIGDTLRRQTNHMVKRQTWGKITDFLRGSNLLPRPPLAAFSANIFQTDCTRASTKDRDGEMYFVILPASRLRRLVPIPAVVWRDGFLAGYEPNLDATAVSISPPDSAVSTIFVLPGQQGLIAPGDTLARLEHHLLGSPYRKGHWSRVMRSLLPRPGLELQIPRMSHKSIINVTSSLQRMGLKDLFSADKADLTGLNGLANDLHLSDMLQINLFSTCGEEPIGARHHSEIYPATPILRREKSADNVFSESVVNLFAVSDFEDPAISALPLELRPRQARVPLSTPGVRIPEPPRLRFDRPFLFFARHNPTGLILHMGRFNPRLMP